MGGTPTIHTCLRCGREFNKKFNYARHLGRQTACEPKTPLQIPDETLVSLVLSAKSPLSSDRVDHLWSTTLYLAHADCERLFDVVWHVISQCTCDQIRSVLQRQYTGAIQTSFVSIYGHLLKLRNEDEVKTVQSKPIDEMISLFQYV